MIMLQYKNEYEYIKGFYKMLSFFKLLGINNSNFEKFSKLPNITESN
jgi:hypothetical protein